MARTPGRADAPCNEPLPFKSRGRTYLGKNCGGLSAHRLARRQFHAHSGWLIQIFRQWRQWYSIQLTMERQDNFGCSSKCPRVLGLVGLGEVSSTVVCRLTAADSHPTRKEGYEPQLHYGSRDSALHLPVEPGGVPVPLLFSFSSTTINGF